MREWGTSRETPKDRSLYLINIVEVDTAWPRCWLFCSCSSPDLEAVQMVPLDFSTCPIQVLSALPKCSWPRATVEACLKSRKQA